MKHRQASPSAVWSLATTAWLLQVQTSSKVSGVCYLPAKSLGKGRVPTSWENSHIPQGYPRGQDRWSLRWAGPDRAAPTGRAAGAPLAPLPRLLSRAHSVPRQQDHCLFLPSESPGPLGLGGGASPLAEDPGWQAPRPLPLGAGAVPAWTGLASPPGLSKPIRQPREGSRAGGRPGLSRRRFPGASPPL